MIARQELYLSAKKLNSARELSLLMPACAWYGAEDKSCLLVVAQTLPAKRKFRYEKYLHFPSHLLPEQLRCFPRDATFLLLLQLGGMEVERSGALVPLSSFLLDRMSWAIDVLGWHSACFANTPSSALLLCDVNNSIISSSLHHSLTTCTHSAKQVPKTALSLCPLPPHNERCQAPSSTNTAEFHPAGE